MVIPLIVLSVCVGIVFSIGQGGVQKLPVVATANDSLELLNPAGFIPIDDEKRLNPIAQWVSYILVAAWCYFAYVAWTKFDDTTEVLVAAVVLLVTAFWPKVIALAALAVHNVMDEKTAAESRSDMLNHVYRHANIPAEKLDSMGEKAQAFIDTITEGLIKSATAYIAGGIAALAALIDLVVLYIISAGN